MVGRVKLRLFELFAIIYGYFCFCKHKNIIIILAETLPGPVSFNQSVPRGGRVGLCWPQKAVLFLIEQLSGTEYRQIPAVRLLSRLAQDSRILYIHVKHQKLV